MNWDGINGRDNNSNIYKSCNPRHESQHSTLIKNTMGIRHFMDIKGALKLSCHHEEKKKGEVNFNPSGKYRLIWDVMTANVGHYLKHGGLDLSLSLNKTSRPSASYADMQGSIQGTKFLKGGQHCIVVDVRSKYIYGWTPRHSLFPKKAAFTHQGPMEVKRMVGILTPLVKGHTQDEGDNRRQLLEEKPCLTMGNHFSDNHVDGYLGLNGWKTCHTTQQGHLLKRLREHFHHIREVEVGQRSKAARFEHPIVAVKEFPAEDGKEAHRTTHVSFQSTGSTHITAVNALDNVDIYVRRREKGQGATKQIWDIEMNEIREFYLNSYGYIFSWVGQLCTERLHYLKTIPFCGDPFLNIGS